MKKPSLKALASSMEAVLQASESFEVTKLAGCSCAVEGPFVGSRMSFVQIVK